jgi:hypothetical protein
VVLATHVAVISRDFILNNQAENEKFEKYSGGNFQIEYTQNDKKMLVKHTFIHETYVIEFQVSYFNNIQYLIDEQILVQQRITLH